MVAFQRTENRSARLRRWLCYSEVGNPAVGADPRGGGDARWPDRRPTVPAERVVDQRATRGVNHMDETQYRLTVKAFARPSAFMEPIDSKLETLERLEREGVIDELTVHVWPDEIPLADGTPYQDVLDAYHRFRAWAEAHGVGLEPPFTVRTEASTFTGTKRTVLRTPMMCVAVYADGLLSNVFPQSRGGEHVSVKEAIGALRTGELELFTVDPGIRGDPPSRCPACQGRLINVQGVGVCDRCDEVYLGREQDDGGADPKPIEPALIGGTPS